MKAALNRADVESFRDLVTPRLGFKFDDDKLDMLADILRQRMKATGCEHYSLYERRFATHASARLEMRRLAQHLTVCETYFFRYLEHFRAFADFVVPHLLRAQHQGPQSQRPQLRLLSAGCASGEEAHSLAILLRDWVPDLSPHNIAIRGIDVNPSMVEKARSAIYSAYSLREMPANLLSKYFHQEGQNFRLDDSVRSLVNFEERNLVEEDPSFWHEGAFDVVFCRNVAMYFTPEAARSVMARIAHSLVPGGFLFLGHAETLRGISQDFHLRHTHDTFYYQRRKDGDADCMATVPLITTARGTSSSSSSSRAVGEPAGSWFEAIQRSSERIVNLTTRENVALRSPLLRSALKDSPANRPLTPENHDAAQSAPRSALPPASPAAPLPAPRWDRILAIELLGEERFEEALELLRTLPPESKADPDAQLLLAVLLTNRGNLAEAEKICQHLLELDELNAGAHYLMALCREHVGDRKAAIAHDEAAVYLDAAFAMPHLHRGLVAKRSCDLETAKEQLGQAVELLAREDASRVLLFGGGFTREALTEFCRTELRSCGGLA
jgi:chemotaxis protein methyltransferase CheR